MRRGTLQGLTQPKEGHVTKGLGIGILALCTVAGMFFANCSFPVDNAYGVGPYLVKDINRSGAEQIAWLTDVDGVLYFMASDGVHGDGLWRSDGTSEGTYMVKDIYPSGDSLPYELRHVDGVLYFRANDGIQGDELRVFIGDPEISVAPFRAISVTCIPGACLVTGLYEHVQLGR
jgi:ELWxxDGT repeat protein